MAELTPDIGGPVGGALEGGGLGSAVGSIGGAEISGAGIPPITEIGSMPTPSPDLAATGLAEDLGPKLEVDTHAALEDVASIDTGATLDTETSTDTPLRTAAEIAMARDDIVATPTEAETDLNTVLPEAAAAETTAEPSTAPAEGEKPAAEPTTTPETADKTAKTQALEAKVKDETATTTEIKELRDLKQNPEQRREDLGQKALDGTITDQEAEELGELNNSEPESKLTPEQQAEKLTQDIDKLSEELMTKFANGQEVTANDLERLRNLRAQESLINQGFSPEQAKAAMREAVTGKGEKQSRAMNEIKGKIQELMALEIQILSVPKTVDALRKQREPVKQAARAKHDQAESASTPEKRLQLKGEEYNLYMQVTNINTTIIRQKYMVPILEAKRADLEQYVRRKVGVTGGLTALMEWGSAKTRNVATQVGVGVAEEMDYTTGNY